MKLFGVVKDLNSAKQRVNSEIHRKIYTLSDFVFFNTRVKKNHLWR